MNLYLDIETIPAQRLDVIAEIRDGLATRLAIDIANVKPPGNYKKQETIDAWTADEMPKAVRALSAQFDIDADAAYRKTGLDGAFGQVCVIGVAFDDEDPLTIWSPDYTDEAALLEDFGCLLVDRVRPADHFATLVIGHNVSAFDLRFLVQRHIVNGYRPHAVIGKAAQAKPWESDKVFDTMTQWAGVGSRISLDKLCRALSVPSPKGEIDGSKVWDFVKAGKISEVADYCARDVEATRAVYKRLTFQAA